MATESIGDGELLYLKSLQERANLIQTIFNDFAAFLRSRYNLNDTDQIDGDTGAIMRIQSGDGAGAETLDAGYEKQS